MERHLWAKARGRARQETFHVNNLVTRRGNSATTYEVINDDPPIAACTVPKTVMLGGNNITWRLPHHRTG